MKPIRLRVAGLNSFREAQEIDFSKLCETGVFGIFGATGSGKSTILDAITLALYGTVERAANNTQGILNHAEEQLTVEYSFSLASGSQRNIYRAERAYRRSGDRTVKASTCRLVEIAEGVETVLAAKADEMTKKMVDLLGLSVEDFTRAVVLPQGKFAEFLTIKPKDRRQMLERLFSLEAYGRELSARLTEQLGSAEFNLNGVEQRQQGLGDASAERVKEAEAELQEAIAKSAGIVQSLTNLKQQYEEAKEIWSLQEQLQQIEEKELQMKGAQSGIAAMDERLSLAERAEEIRSILAEIRLSEERFREAKGQLEDAEARLKAARLVKETAEEKWSEGNRKRLEVEPRCLRRLEQLEQARSIELDIQARQERLTDTRLQYAKLDRSRKELEEKLQSALDKKAAAQKHQQDLKVRLTQISVDPLQRTQVNTSAQALEAYEIVSRQADGLQRDLVKNTLELEERQLKGQTFVAEVQTAQQALEQLKEALTKGLQNPPVREELLSDRAQELEGYRHIIANLERGERERREEEERWQVISADCQKSQAQVESGEQEQEAALAALQESVAIVEQKTAEVQGLEQTNLAGQLVENLVEGEPCPVCGSAHHPKPAQSIADGILFKARNELEEASGELRKLEAQRTKAATALAVAKAQLSAKQELEQNRLAILETKKRAIVEYRQELPEADRDQDIRTLNARRAEQEAKLTNDRLVLNQWKTEQELLSQQVEEARRKLAEADKEQHIIQARIAAAAGVRNEIENRLNLVLEERAQRKEQLDRLRGGIALADISVIQKQYAAWDQEMGTINQDLVALEKGLQEADEARQRLVLEKTNCELELQNLKTVGSEAARELAELKSKCETLTEGKPALEMTEQVKQELALVTGTAEKLQKAYELAKEVWNQAEQTQAVSSKTLELSREGYQAAQSKLELGLKTAQFLTVAAAQSALCGEDERLKMEQDIAAFRQDVLLLKQKRAECEERLKGRSLRPEEWLAWPIRLKEADKAYTDAIERRGATQQRLEKLKAAHENWLSLEHARQALSRRRSLLRTLQSVFKGNAFVEFIAQEQLTNVSLAASERLKQLTNQRYALEVDAEGGFIMRDDANGGVRRPVGSLSGGETFLTALALALALSTQIQLRGESPLEFFFLDEGFGTLDADLLETVMNTLEKLHLQNLAIGIISHVPELKNRLSRRLLVTSAEAGGAGSKVKLEMA
jgi:exonuclease SbcC